MKRKEIVQREVFKALQKHNVTLSFRVPLQGTDARRRFSTAIREVIAEYPSIGEEEIANVLGVNSNYLNQVKNNS